ncbi:MAG: geranylgeranylglyceryl/heptaprenylglyceryl phosphate synthase [archaeon]
MIYEKILEKMKESTLHFTLIDPDEQTPEKAGEKAKIAEESGSDAILVGGSGVDFTATDSCVKEIKKSSKLPVILFPGNITGVSKHADAILFMSLLNSRSNYWLSLAQAMSAFTVKTSKLEVIPMGYLVVESGKKTSVEFYGDANAIPYNKPKIAAAFALAAELMGMKVVYLEAGSGALIPVPDEMISFTKKAISIPLIVGGGIKDPEIAKKKAKAGADIIVTGTIFEQDEKKLASIIEAIKSVRKP